MWDYIVMGQIPGTSVQVTFLTWLFIVASLLVVSLIALALRSALRTTTHSEASAVATPIGYPAAVAHDLATRGSLSPALKLLVALRISHAMQKAAYSHWLIARRQIQA